MQCAKDELQSTYEINFRVGVYFAGLRVLTFEPPATDPLAPNPATAFLPAFAGRQAERRAGRQSARCERGLSRFLIHSVV